MYGEIARGLYASTIKRYETVAQVFVKHQDNVKGVVVFTHKEYYNFLKKEVAADTLALIKKHYIVGIHFGWYHKDPEICDFVDFLLASEGTVEFTKDCPVPRLKMSSRNFVSERFDNSNNTNRFWDIACISRDAKFKNLDKFLVSIRKLFDEYGPCKVALVSTGQTSKVRDASFFYADLISDYYEMFTEEERDSFVLIRPDTALGSGGINETFIAFLLANSKVLTLFSTLEGDTRVPSEGLLSGCKVVVSKHLKGGGTDLLTDYNSVQFDRFDEAHEALHAAVTSHESYTLKDEDRLQVYEKESINRVVEFLKSLYPQDVDTSQLTFINTNSLSRRLPGHYHDVPWINGRENTADIMTFKQLETFMSYCQV